MPYAGMGDVMGSPLMGSPTAPAAPAAPAAPPASPPAAPPAQKKKVELHMVYTDWCGHSKRALPHFDKVQQEYHGKDLGTHVVEVHKHDAETPEGTGPPIIPNLESPTLPLPPTLEPRDFKSAGI